MSTSDSAVTTTTTTLNADISAGVGIALSVTMILSFFIFFVSGSFLSVIVFWLVLIMSVVILVTYGYLPSTMFATKAATTKTPAAASSGSPSGYGLVGMEVFHISDNNFTYDEAQAGCAAFGGTLATMEQVTEAYDDGAEWCGYGWSAGGLALFPTQRGTWEALQQEIDPAKRTACGRVGVNGGYFDPSSKFGLNCYGYKPAATKKMTFPSPPPGGDNAAFQAAVNKFQGMLSSFTVSPYSRQQWSGYGAMGSNASAAASYGSQFSQNLGGLGSNRSPVHVTTESFTTKEDLEMLERRQNGYSFINQPAYAPLSQAEQEAVPGPTGPAGHDGATGPTGPTGPAGRDASPAAAAPATTPPATTPPATTPPATTPPATTPPATTPPATTPPATTPPATTPVTFTPPSALDTAIAAWKTANPGATITESIHTWLSGHLGAQNINNYAAGTKKGDKDDACSGPNDCLLGAACTNSKCTKA